MVGIFEFQLTLDDITITDFPLLLVITSVGIIDSVLELILGVGIVIVILIGIATLASGAVQMSLGFSTVQGTVASSIAVFNVALFFSGVMAMVFVMLTFYDILLGHFGHNRLVVRLIIVVFEYFDWVVNFGNGMMDGFVVDRVLGDEGIVHLFHRSGLGGRGEDGKS